MKITLEQPEIEAAIKQHIGPTGWGIPLDGQEISIEMKAGRGEKGFSAEIELTDISPQVEEDAKAEDSAEEDDQAIDFDFKETDD